MRISRIRRTRRRIAIRRAQVAGAPWSEVEQSLVVEELVPRRSGWRPHGTLTPTLHVAPQAVANVRVDLPPGDTRVAPVEVLPPAPEMQVELCHQDGKRFDTGAREQHGVNHPLLLEHRLLRRHAVQIAVPTTQEVTVVSERVAEEVQTRARIVEVDPACL